MNKSIQSKIIGASISVVALLSLIFSGFGSRTIQKVEGLADTSQARQQVSLSGWFNVIWGDPGPGSKATSQAIYILTDDGGQSTQVLLTEELARPSGGIIALSGKRVTVTGEWLSAAAQAFGLPILRLQSINLDATVKVPSAPAISGSQPWVSILCKFNDVAAEPNPRSYFRGMYGDTYPGLGHYWRELSYNAINLVGSTAAGWYRLPQPRSYYVYDQDRDGAEELDHYRALQDCTALANPDVNFSRYAGINMMFNADLDGYAWGGTWWMTLDGATRSWAVTWEPPWGYQNLTTMAHEMGHGFGLPHSGGAGLVYNDPWDVMGDMWHNCDLSSDPVYGCLGQHTISYNKDTLNWIPAGKKYVVPTSSQAMITLEQLALPQTGNYRMAQIPIEDSTTHSFVVEARRKVGYDVKLPGEAVIIHDVDTNRPGITSMVVDADNNGDTGDDGAMWMPGETFTDPASRITVSVDAATPTGFVVTIANPTPCYTLKATSEPSEGATISADPLPDCDNSTKYTAGTVVQLQANVWDCCDFIEWGGDISGSSPWVSIVMDRDKFVWALLRVLPIEAPFEDGFESGGMRGWDTSGMWHVIDQGSPYPEAHNSENSFWFGQDATGDYAINGLRHGGDLTSPPIVIPDAGYALTFWSWYETESAGTARDQRLVQISTDGAIFTAVAQLSGDPMRTWVQPSPISLAGYAGQTIYIRFRFDTIDGEANNFRGWYVDDVSVKPMASDLIFADGFESGDLSAWSSHATDGSDLAVTTGAALIGKQGLRAKIDDNNAIHVTDDTPNAEPRYRAKFYFDPNSIVMANGDTHFIFYGYTGTSKAVLRVGFRRYSGNYQLRVSILNDGTSWKTSNWFTIGDGPHVVELDWRAAMAAGANNGGVTLWIDDMQNADLTGVDNDTRRIDRIRLGAVASIDSGTRGTEYFDAFESRR